METFTDLFLPALLAAVFMLILVPMLRKLAIRIQLVDKPNERKVHSVPVPLIGGIAIAIASGLTLMISNTFMQAAGAQMLMMLGAAAVMLCIGVFDDKLDIRASYKLLIQLGCAYFMTASGTRITSLYGLFGVNDIPLWAQYVLTNTVIVGVVNAFNLMDGVDGLAGSLALTGFIALSVLAYMQGMPEFAVLYAVFAGALVAFLRFNLGRNKIFMGDGGSLFMGFILVVSGLKILQPLSDTHLSRTSPALLIVIGIFLLPVLDSLRVYRSRIKNGDSPFKADKSHIHHLFLLMGFDHKKTVFSIVIFSILLIAGSLVLSLFIPLTLILLITIIVFILFTNVLMINKQVLHWRDRIKELESRK